MDGWMDWKRFFIALLLDFFNNMFFNAAVWWIVNCTCWLLIRCLAVRWDC